MTLFLRSVQSEWLKRRRSLTGWLVLAAGLFTPVIIFLFRIAQPAGMPVVYRSTTFWESLWTQTWESVAVMLLPMFVIVATGLVLNLETRNNAWKQLHASPQPLWIIFLAKLVVLLIILAQFFVVLNLGIYLCGVVPALLIDRIPTPESPIPFGLFWTRNLHYFAESLPIVALQFALGLRFRNVMVPIGAGMGLWLLAVGTLSWKFNYLFLFSHPAIDYFKTTAGRVGRGLPAEIHLIALAAFVALLVAGYVGYRNQTERG